MEQTINKQVVFNYPVTAGATTFVIGDYQKYTYVSLQVVWSTFNTADGTAKMQQKNDINVSTWDDIPTLTVAMTTAGGSETREHINFGGKFLGLNFNPGTNTTGTINVYLIAK